MKFSLCGSGIETTVHSLFLCPKMKFLWKKSGMVDCLSAAKTGNMVDVAFWAKDQLSSNHFELFAMYTCEIWNLKTHGLMARKLLSRGMSCAGYQSISVALKPVEQQCIIYLVLLNLGTELPQFLAN